MPEPAPGFEKTRFYQNGEGQAEKMGLTVNPESRWGR